MTYKVQLTYRARQDAKESAAYLRERSPQAALKWMGGLKKLQDRLATFPSRFSKVPHTEVLRHDYRAALHYSHKVIFYIDDESNTVYIVRVYHSARKPLASAEEIEFE